MMAYTSWWRSSQQCESTIAQGTNWICVSSFHFHADHVVVMTTFFAIHHNACTGHYQDTCITWCEKPIPGRIRRVCLASLACAISIHGKYSSSSFGESIQKPITCVGKAQCRRDWLLSTDHSHSHNHRHRHHWSRWWRCRWLFVAVSVSGLMRVSCDK